MRVADDHPAAGIGRASRDVRGEQRLAVSHAACPSCENITTGLFFTAASAARGSAVREAFVSRGRRSSRFFGMRVGPIGDSRLHVVEGLGVEQIDAP